MREDAVLVAEHVVAQVNWFEDWFLHRFYILFKILVGHYPKINPFRTKQHPSAARRGAVRPVGIYFWIMTALIIRLLAKNDRRHSSKIPLFNDLVAVS